MSSQTASARKTVLVVDDSVAVLMLITTILGDGPYEMMEATSADEAMQIAAQQHIDLLITDVEMPEMSGGELLAALKTKGAVTHCLLISGASMDELRETYRTDPLVRFLAKPFRAEQLLREIRALFESCV